MAVDQAAIVEQASALRVSYVPGVTLGKWTRVWGERMRSIPLDLIQLSEADQVSALRAGQADVGFVRLPVDREGLHTIPLYSEKPVVIVPKEHAAALFDEVSATELAGETMLRDTDAWTSVADDLALAVELVAAGTGLLVVPMSVARLHHRRDVEYRVVTDLPESEIALAWRADDRSPLIEEWIGVVRGRTANSSRGAPTEPAAPQKDSKPQAGKPRQGKHAKPPGKRPRPPRQRRGR